MGVPSSTRGQSCGCSRRFGLYQALIPSSYDVFVCRAHDGDKAKLRSYRQVNIDVLESHAPGNQQSSSVACAPDLCPFISSTQKDGLYSDCLVQTAWNRSFLVIRGSVQIQ